jgi:cyclic pyranopterin phosphate synthase
LTRRDALDDVLRGVDAAVEAGFDRVKVNVVVMRGVNDDELVDLARFGRERGVEVRFIEFMPLDADRRWAADAVVTQEEIVRTVDAEFPLKPMARGPEPAEQFEYLDGGGVVGVIPSVTRPFCGTCDRIRLSADGQFRNCLFALDEIDLRTPLRGGATDDELGRLIEANVAAKWAGHQIGQVTFIRPSKSMSQIGG